MIVTKKSKLLLAYYALVVAYWAYLFFSDIKFTPVNYYYQFVFGLIPLVGGVMGLYTARKWGFLTSKVGRGVFFLSLGLVTWGIGQMFWSYYTIFTSTEMPYPSLADVGYIVSWPLWTVGMIYLSIATGAKSSLRRLHGKIQLFAIPLVAIAASYYLLFIVARGGQFDLTGGGLKLFFDFAYPVGDIVILTLALLIFGLSANYLGGKFKLPIIAVILGFIVNYATDFSFSYTTTAGTYYNGNWVDLLFPTAMFLLAFGVNSIDPAIVEDKA